jgi:hypothetical protein
MRYLLIAIAELVMLLHIGSTPRHGYRPAGTQFAAYPLGGPLVWPTF